MMKPREEAMLTRRALLAGATAWPLSAAATSFPWPRGKRGALSFTFDDARASQIDVGLPFFSGIGLRATFYVSPASYRRRIDGWRSVVGYGHEIGHHSLTHPCSVNYRFSRENALEDYTLEKMSADLDAATLDIQETFGVTPVSFAYPCGQSYVGRGTQRKSYVPLIAQKFLSGRGFMNESANDPARCDLAYLMGMSSDGLNAISMLSLVEAAMTENNWLILAGHEVGKAGPQSTDTDALREVWRYAQNPANGIWTGTVAEISGYMAKQRGA
jgi:hypothetical protein